MKYKTKGSLIGLGVALFLALGLFACLDLHGTGDFACVAPMFPGILVDGLLNQLPFFLHLSQGNIQVQSFIANSIVLMLIGFVSGLVLDRRRAK